MLEKRKKFKCLFLPILAFDTLLAVTKSEKKKQIKKKRLNSIGKTEKPSGWGISAVTLNIIGKEDKDQNSHNLWKVSEGQSEADAERVLKGSIQKCLINSGFCVLSIPVVFNNIQHPPGWRREERKVLHALNIWAG